MPAKKPNVELIEYTPTPDKLVAMAARICYSPDTLEDLSQQVSKKDQSAFIERLMDMRHMSPIEHAVFTFGIEGVSRSVLAQITRHRIASFSVQSQRYVTHKKLEYVLPKSISVLGEEAERRFDEQMETIQGFYEEWVNRGVPSEDARFVLPNAACTRMIVTMNARELHHFFALRCCNRAQWEIQAVAWKMLEKVMAVSPDLFANAGPACASGPCPEGKKSCGRVAEMRQRVGELANRVEEDLKDE